MANNENVRIDEKPVKTALLDIKLPPQAYLGRSWLENRAKIAACHGNSPSKVGRAFVIRAAGRVARLPQLSKLRLSSMGLYVETKFYRNY
jgi:hypothetical protein